MISPTIVAVQYLPCVLISVVTDSESASVDVFRVRPNLQIFAAVSDGFGMSAR